MENLWKFSVTEPEEQTPKEILKEQAELLPAITGDMTYASVVEVSESAVPLGFANQFIYKFIIKSKFLPNYQFRVLTVSHSIPFYPAKVMTDDEIKKELQFEEWLTTVENEEQFKELLRKILSSNRLGTVISSIIQLSK